MVAVYKSKKKAGEMPPIGIGPTKALVGAGLNWRPLIVMVVFLQLVGSQSHGGSKYDDLSKSSSSLVASRTQTPKDCHRKPWSGSSGLRSELYELICDLRSVNSIYDSTNFTVIPSAGVVSLTIRCSEAVGVQSHLLNSSFLHLEHLQELNLVQCKFGSVPSGAFHGLSRLQNLSIHTEMASTGEAELTHLSNSQGHPRDSLEPDDEEKPVAGLSFVELRGLARSCPHLTRLDLARSGLTGLDAGHLCQMEALTHLNLSSNRISEISALGASPGPHLPCREIRLQNLDLSENFLTTLNPGEFTTMSQLKALYLTRNRIEQVHDGALEGLRSLRVLDLSGNKIEALPGRLFHDTPDLRQLKLDHNRLSVVSPKLFQPAVNLIVLDLSFNSLTTSCPPTSNSEATEASSYCLTVHSFAGLSRLIVLNLSSNKISGELAGQAGRKLFQDLSNLQILDLSSNKITALGESTFDGLRNLHTLRLTDNLLAELRSNSLAGLPALNTLNLDNNSLTHIHNGSLSNLSQLQDLNLFGNRLEVIPEALANVASIKTIDLGGNRLKTIKANRGKNALEPLPNLIGLKLDRNEIDQIFVDDLTGLDSLQILNLADNNISVVARGAFNSNKKLQAIRLDANKIADIVGLFNDLSSLRWLNISDNQIQKFDYFLLPTALNWLDIHKNLIEDIGNYFDKEADLNLHTMDISFNRLKAVTAKSIPDKIKILSLNDNQINRVDPLTFYTKRHLTRVDLYANQIVKLETNAVRLGPSAEDPESENRPRPEFYLGGNPFLCDCNLEWLKTINNDNGNGGGDQKRQSAVSNYPVVSDLESIYCRLIYSQENAYIPLVEARPTEFLCPYTTHCFALCHCCDFDACDCEMTCPDNCTCYHDQSWSSNIVDCAGAEFLEPPAAIPMDATEVYLHGNNFQMLSSHSFIGRKNLRVLYLNHSNIEAVLNYTFFGLRRLTELHLEHNVIQRLEGHEFQSLNGLRSLYLQHNSIRYVNSESFVPLQSLEILRLDHNRLKVFPSDHYSLFSTATPYLVELSMANNPWSCECSSLLVMLGWMRDNRAKISDIGQVACHAAEDDNKPRYLIIDESYDDDDDVDQKMAKKLSDLSNSDGSFLAAAAVHLAEEGNSDCSDWAAGSTIVLTSGAGGADGSVLTALTGSSSQQQMLSADQLPVLIVSLSLLTVLCVGLGVVVFYRHEIQVWAFGRWGVRLCQRHTSGASGRRHLLEEDDKLYDAYVAYSIKDEAFVGQVLAPELEQGPAVAARQHRSSAAAGGGHRLCLHYRDFPANAYVADSIVEAVSLSRRTVLVLSKNFIVHEWSRYEIRSALREALAPTTAHSAVSGKTGKSSSSSGPAIILVLGDPPMGGGTGNNGSNSSSAKNSLNALMRDLDPDLRLCLKSGTVIHWSDRQFWDKLRFNLPQPRPSTMAASTLRGGHPQPSSLGSAPVHHNRSPTDMLASLHSGQPGGFILTGGGLDGRHHDQVFAEGAPARGDPGEHYMNDHQQLHIQTAGGQLHNYCQAIYEVPHSMNNSSSNCSNNSSSGASSAHTLIYSHPTQQHQQPRTLQHHLTLHQQQQHHVGQQQLFHNQATIDSRLSSKLY